MFLPMVQGFSRDGLPCRQLVAYLERHIEVDGGHHGPLAALLLERLFEGDARRTAEARRAAVVSLEARRDLWTSTYDAIRRASDEQPVARIGGRRRISELLGLH
jgi:hypothetical protein